MNQGVAQCRNVPFRATEPEAVGELALESVPEGDVLLLGKFQQSIVVLLESLVRLDNVRVLCVGTVLAAGLVGVAILAVSAHAAAAVAILHIPC